MIEWIRYYSRRDSENGSSKYSGAFITFKWGTLTVTFPEDFDPETLEQEEEEVLLTIALWREQEVKGLCGSGEPRLSILAQKRRLPFLDTEGGAAAVTLVRDWSLASKRRSHD